MAIARINGIDLYYEEHGDVASEPLLLIMGFAMNATAWGLQIPAFSERYHVIAYDNRGVGRTSQPDGEYSIPQMAADAVALLDHLGIASANIVSMSMGGMIAQELALRYPKRVRALVLGCTTPGGPHSAGYDEMLAASTEGMALADLSSLTTPEGIKEGMDRLFTAEFQAHPPLAAIQLGAAGLLFPQSLAGMKGQLAAIISHDTYDRLPKITAPTLVITGDADVFVDARNSPILARRIPNAKLIMLPGQRHGFAVEKPEETNQAILHFLDEATAAPAAKPSIWARLFGRRVA